MEAGGGGSGAGSINIFYNSHGELPDTIGQAAGGDGGSPCSYGSSVRSSAGGNGSISVGNISTGTYVSDYKNY